jgi:hypothetical protein
MRVRRTILIRRAQKHWRDRRYLRRLRSQVSFFILLIFVYLKRSFKRQNRDHPDVPLVASTTTTTSAPTGLNSNINNNNNVNGVGANVYEQVPQSPYSSDDSYTLHQQQTPAGHNNDKNLAMY